MLTGASLAGALRNHLNDCLLGYGRKEDIPASASPGGQAHSGDETLPANSEGKLVALLATALEGLEQGEIRVGARRTRGLGSCTVENWRVRRFDLASARGWLDWLVSDHERPTAGRPAANNVRQAIGQAKPDLKPPTLPAGERRRIRIDLTLVLDAGLLVRSSAGSEREPDAAHLKSADKPILPGTGFAGALRARALRIARKVAEQYGRPDDWSVKTVDAIFGPRHIRGRQSAAGQNKPHASRLRSTEQAITGGAALHVTQLRIDRFTGGPVDGALFDEAPHFGGQIPRVQLELRSPRDGEFGLLLLVIKDLLTGDLPLGGASSVGRGVVKGIARIQLADGSAVVLNPEQVANPETVRRLNDEVKKFHALAKTGQPPGDQPAKRSEVPA